MFVTLVSWSSVKLFLFLNLPALICFIAFFSAVLLNKFGNALLTPAPINFCPPIATGESTAPYKPVLPTVAKLTPPVSAVCLIILSPAPTRKPNAASLEPFVTRFAPCAALAHGIKI